MMNDLYSFCVPKEIVLRRRISLALYEYMLVLKRTAKITRAKGLHTPVSAAFLLAVAFVKHVIFALLEDGSFLHGLYDTVFHDSGKWAMSCSFIARYAYM